MHESSHSTIRITREEATSQHVDDLLKRQMSLRGEPGIAREHGRAWYLQSWIVLGVVGIACSLIAWLLIEPHMHDTLRLQGQITSFQFLDEPTTSISWKGQAFTLKHPTVGRLDFGDQSVWLVSGVREYANGRIGSFVELPLLRQGQEVAVYVHDGTGDVSQLAIAYLIDLHPPPAEKPGSPTLQEQQAEARAAGLLFFAVVAGIVGFGIGAVDGLICRLPRRALLCGAVGLVVGFVGGFMSSLLANAVYGPITEFAVQCSEKGGWRSSAGFGLQVLGRMLAWGMAGSTMGLAQGLALRSSRLLGYGFIGGVVGGILGGMFFDPIDVILIGDSQIGAATSRAIGLGIIGLSVGALIGVVELFARDAWLRMVQGPLKGKEFLLFKDVMQIGSSPKSDLYLFNDSRVTPQHAVIRAVGEEYEIEAKNASPLLINNSAVARSRLRHGDQVAIGDTIFTFQKRNA